MVLFSSIIRFYTYFLTIFKFNFFSYQESCRESNYAIFIIKKPHYFAVFSYFSSDTTLPLNLYLFFWHKAYHQTLQKNKNIYLK